MMKGEFIMNERYVWIGIILFVIVIAAAVKICVQISHECRSSRQRVRAVSGRNQVQRTLSGRNEAQRTLSGERTEFGPVNYFANDRHQSKDKWFQFKYKKVGGKWLAYIQRMPNLNGRDPNLHFTHRYHSENMYWVCYDPQPETLKDAQIVSKRWADRELEYISTGIKFEDQRW
ncbi:MAG: hypothetical protein Q4C50_05060 [Eubacteriales bacterium]|nr:hypothetical protein [Eubacteriales bacterium]